MSFYPFIIPAVTFVSFFMYIFMSQRAWLPKAGTTEWIRRSAFPKKMSESVLHSLQPADFALALVTAIICGGISTVTGSFFFPFTGAGIVYFICSELTVGIVFLTARMLFGTYRSAILAAVFTVSDITLLSLYSASPENCAGLFLIALYVLFICLSLKKPLLLMFAGVLLGAAVYYNTVFSVFVVFGAAVTFTAAHIWGKKQLYWMFPLFSVLLSGIVCCVLSYLISVTILPQISFTASYACLDPVYLFCAAVCVIITIIHIFREKSFSALFISVGALSSAACVFMGVPAAGIFAGLAMAFSGNIIITRGKLPHKLFAVIFAVMLFAGVILTGCLLLSLPYPAVFDIFEKLAGYWIYF